MVVLVILGLLVGYVAPRYFAQLGKSEVKSARAQVNSLEKTLESDHRNDCMGIGEGTGRITGVFSLSTLKPFKQDGFPREFVSFANTEHYTSGALSTH